MVSYTILILASLMAATLAAPCTPAQGQAFYWKVPCDGQTFPNRIDVSNVVATQNGKTIDQLGGMDLSQKLDLTVQINDKYGVINKPLIDIKVEEFYLRGGQCVKKNLPTLGLLDNVDSCTILQNCHLQNNPTSLSAAIDFQKLAGPLMPAINVNSYYGLSLTFKDDKNQVMCVYAQYKVLKK